MRSSSRRCSSSLRRRIGSWPEWPWLWEYGAMCRLCSHISPPSRCANDSASCTFDSRSDFTSLPAARSRTRRSPRCGSCGAPRGCVATTWMPSSAASPRATTLPAARLGPTLASPPMLRMSEDAYAAMIGHAYDGLPDEACGLLVGPLTSGRRSSGSRRVATRRRAVADVHDRPPRPPPHRPRSARTTGSRSWA